MTPASQLRHVARLGYVHISTWMLLNLGYLPLIKKTFIIKYCCILPIHDYTNITENRTDLSAPPFAAGSSLNIHRNYLKIFRINLSFIHYIFNFHRISLIFVPRGLTLPKYSSSSPQSIHFSTSRRFWSSFLLYLTVTRACLFCTLSPASRLVPRLGEWILLL